MKGMTAGDKTRTAVLGRVRRSKAHEQTYNYAFAHGWTLAYRAAQESATRNSLDPAEFGALMNTVVEEWETQG